MLNIVKNTWALFFGFSLICLGHGLQGTLLGIRSKVEGFSLGSIGFIITGYFVGYLIGSLLIPLLLKRVGHIRVFAALASIASVAILIHSLFINVQIWFLIRIITGICFAGFFIITESWLNDKSENKTRGKILSIYLIITFLFTGLGNFLLNLSDPKNYDLFILISILLSMALIPILLSISSAPEFIHPKRITIKELYQLSPLGLVSGLLIGLAHSSVFGYGAVYAISKNLSTINISIFMFIISFFGALFQWPIGYISDKIDRRILLIIVNILAAILSLMIIGFSYISIIIFYIILACYSGMCLPMYSLAIAHINDFLNKNEIVSVASSFALVVGIGAIFGPIFSSFFMEYIGPDGFFVHLFLIHIILSIFGIYRLSQRDKPKIESQYVPLPRNITPAGMEMNPKIDLDKN
ncbi:MAG: putative MFS-type transporter YcaD [Alphaproteobacteria bacterium MarineAlpha5_Bin9]|nr:MAG: putative MFS-type transporter YcaD [Alphaproteobacteria bacterium MarineAlpha5_Bin9]|tara:strand:- start:5742 stop:6974 length:1233 start_codon:yes stop_codon:yes gene_type:complete